jgi:hypothetical protein
VQATSAEREAALLAQLDAARRQRSEAEGRAAAAAAAAAAAERDSQLWQAGEGLVSELKAEMSQQAAGHRAELTALRDKLAARAQAAACDELVARQAATINALEQQLAVARAGAGAPPGVQDAVGQLQAELRHTKQQHAAAVAAWQQEQEALQQRLEQQQRLLVSACMRGCGPRCSGVEGKLCRHPAAP